MRKERDLRAAENRLKQYEIEMGELKAKNETYTFDLNRRSDENVVSLLIHLIGSSIETI
jgi:hypothetical protein